MSWQVALVLFYITGVGQALFQRSYSQQSKLPLSLPPALSYLVGVTPLGIIVGLLAAHHIHWSLWLGCLLIIEGVFIGLYNWLSFKAIKQLPVTRFETIYQSYEIITIVLGWILLGERLTTFEIYGAVLLIAAALLAVQAPKSHSVQSLSRHKRAVILALLSAVAMGIGLIAEKAALGHMDRGAYFIFGYGTQTIALVILASRDIRRRSLRHIGAYEWKRSAIMGSLSAVVGFFYIIGITKSNNISLITSLTAFILPLIAIASYLFLHEKEDLKLLWSGTALGCLGLIITALH
jgi:drug/metabolite transporter (DMT)-like permease